MASTSVALRRIGWRSSGWCEPFSLSRELDRLTVLENVAGETLNGALFLPWRTRSVERSVVARARDLLALVSLSAHEAKPAASLSGGQKKLLELARCLMAGARTILLDEVAAGVAPPVVEDIAKLVLALNQQGTTFVVIEHNIGVIRQLASRVIVLAGGRVLAEGSFAEVSSNLDVVASYLGQAA
ncbi:ATP-binding cassette domain-containing protein [Rhodopseudomonas palustris]|uniref:ATP-binding cassette domain-containing protein n=1 Tax=Rhodopseudomonas palustris TaxID=1076 RepID=UPI000E5B2673|nr:ATP-binding cassette domain-containing protein [Rhodopseudomonas palustris]RIA03857.1 ATP-binding cassette domain-containing protein [Rhodopseudomonas palustris]